VIVPFGQTITNKSDVTDRIRRAQRAILSPTIPADAFLTGDGMENTQPEFPFSHNCIVLRISGSDVTDLNFIDLPGSFSDTLSFVFNVMCAGLFSGGQNEDMDLVKNLTVSYIQKPSCLILLTVACESMFASKSRNSSDQMM
jgi:hypothetical protein